MQRMPACMKEVRRVGMAAPRYLLVPGQSQATFLHMGGPCHNTTVETGRNKTSHL